MSKKLVSASGERAAMGGYVPQFSEFARFAYRELVAGKLEWIKVADPDAQKLDDIQYSTPTEVHGYQVKWTIAAEKISYTDFVKLLPLIVKSWQALKAIHAKDGKKVFGHLLTNKELSVNDTIVISKSENKTFSDFYMEVFLKWEAGGKPNKKWDAVIKDLIKSSGVSSKEFYEFIEHFEFHPSHVPKDISVNLRKASIDVGDHLDLKNFIEQKVAGEEREVTFTKSQLLTQLNWESRFKTIFNHELTVDKNRYQQITTTTDELNEKLKTNSGGYLFLTGGPGTGKSTLLTQWSKNQAARIIRYYAFDFTNPSANVNYFKRGEATHLYFDLVLQIKERGIYRSNVAPYQDLNFLKQIFASQIQQLGEEYNRTGRKTILIIDGLDHVPREYKSVAESFLRELPLPADLPEGIYILLGSQNYELDDLSLEIKQAAKEAERAIKMNQLDKSSVQKYIESSDLEPALSSSQAELLNEKSQGHPLYLSYLIEKVRDSDDRDEALNDSIAIDGNIDLYYQKIWGPISREERLSELMGLVARINGPINLDFIKEWKFNGQTLQSFRKDAKMLFDEYREEWVFFHNSYRQFLLSHTSKDPLKDVYDEEINQDYHKKLAQFYQDSRSQPQWRKNLHLFSAGEYDTFIEQTSPEVFLEQLTSFRPPEEIKTDIKLGLEIAENTQEIPTLLRYLFSLAELNRRLQYIDPAGYVLQHLQLGRLDIAKGYVRSGSTLLVNQTFALKCAGWFAQAGDYAEGILLFDLAEPEMITKTGIVVDYSERFEQNEIDLLNQWVIAASTFEKFETVYDKIKSLSGINVHKDMQQIMAPEDLKLTLLTTLGYILIADKKWRQLEILLKEFDLGNNRSKDAYYQILKHGAEDSAYNGDRKRSKEILNEILSNFTIGECSEVRRIFIAEMIVSILEDQELAREWLKEVSQPIVMNHNKLGHHANFSIFRPLIKFNKTLNMIGDGQNITTAIPGVQGNFEESLLVEFQRMICLITQLLTDAKLEIPITGLKMRIMPIVQFYNRPAEQRNTYWFRIRQLKNEYFRFLVSAIAKFGGKPLRELADYLFEDFTANPAAWESNEKRALICALFQNGYDIDESRAMIISLEKEMLQGLDISGRVSECIDHVNALILIGDKEKATEWIKQAFSSSIGVGYRKDYQFNTWISWLEKYIERNPENAIEPIKWFLSQFDHLRESTEGRAAYLAATSILRLSLGWNFAAGTEVLKWQIDSGRTDFEDAIATFISVYLDKAETKEEFEAIMPLYKDIFLPISLETNTRLLKKILERGTIFVGEDFLNEPLNEIHTSILMKALEETRASLMSELATFAETRNKEITTLIPGFVIPEDHNQNRSSEYPNRLVLKLNHETLDEIKIEESINSVDEFIELYQKEDKLNSSFDWTKILERLISDFTAAQIKEVADFTGNRSQSITVLSKLAVHAQGLNEAELAEELINKSIAQSSSSGWTIHYDGGTRLKSLNALRTVKGESAKKKAFEIFVKDAMESESAYIQELDEILPVISPGYSVDIVWPELFNYLKRLMANSESTIELPALIAEYKPLMDILINLVYHLSKFPLPLIHLPARDIFASFIAQNEPVASRALLNPQLVHDENTEFFTEVLLRAKSMGGNLNPYITQLTMLGKSENFTVREEAIQLLKSLKVEAPAPTLRQLPEVYALRSVEYTDSFSPKETTNLIKPFDATASLLADLTGLDEKILQYRISSLMKSSGELEKWSAENENKLRTRLDELGLRFSFNRHRLNTATRAASRLITELLDSGQLSLEDAQLLFQKRNDPGNRIQYSLKPEFITRITNSETSSSAKNWTENIKDNPRLQEPMFKTKDDTYIIAEYSFQKSLNWDTPSQTFMSQIKANREKSTDWFIFGSEECSTFEDYHDLQTDETEIILLKTDYSSPMRQKSSFLTINPALARKLGWILQSEKMFAWEDSQGHTMVESKFWQDGNVEMTPPHLYSESGEGWYVEASEIAVQQIRKLYPELYFEIAVSRTSSKGKQASASIIDSM